ncbi:SDR family oxidoreductase [Sphingobacterium faecium]|uniref:SDR family oxidoreductase n=1 Tax=Sphingobacterium faecium TaxID=34087 RepID=UPI000D3AB5A5|nr:SDR family oxidoreductase [Sphingobacterium faecium]MQP28138.1 SDR family NAD(P)-dependent oxidoreductase [Sphingobacterium faecium]PTX10119.1 short-subunit dehydrogenase [Sphingobacterium faecium]
MKTYLIFGISKGLGKVITKSLPDEHDEVFGISRSKPNYLKEKSNVKWISTDLSNPKNSSETIRAHIGNKKIDYFIYNVGIWESNAFTEKYSFEENDESEICTLIDTNITSCILNIKAVIKNLKQSENAKVILIGSTWGLDNHNGKEVTFAATKFALRGVVHALRENLRAYKIGVSILNLGYLATEFENDENVETVIKQTEGNLIPLQDVINALKFIISTSNASCVKEINMPAMNDVNV